MAFSCDKVISVTGDNYIGQRNTGGEVRTKHGYPCYQPNKLKGLRFK